MSNILNEAAERAKQTRQEQEKKEARWAEIQQGYEACDVLIEEALSTPNPDPHGQPYTDIEKLDEAKRMKAALEAIEREEFGERENHPMADRPYVASKSGPSSVEEALTDPSEWKELDTTTASPENAEELRRVYGGDN